MASDKDRMGEKLRQKERADEDRFFGERDRALVERMKQEKAEAATADAQAAAHMRCPKCGAGLATVMHHDVSVEECPDCHGMWLDQGELETLAARERDGWLGRFFFRPRR